MKIANNIRSCNKCPICKYIFNIYICKFNQELNIEYYVRNKIIHPDCSLKTLNN